MNIPPDCRSIMDRLAGQGAKVFLAGGCVRDSLLGGTPKDFDIVTDFEPERILEIFPKGHYHGKSFGVVTVAGYEIATFRQGRHSGAPGDGHGLAFVTDVEPDLGRRDFTINAMALDRSGDLIDPFGGRADLEAGIVRFVGDPADRIRDDSCRLLRGCRFVGLLGGAFNETTRQAIEDHGESVRLVAKERVRAEILKMMEVHNVVPAVEAMRLTGILPFIFPPLQACVGVEQNRYHADTVYVHSLLSAGAVPPRMPLLRLAMLLHDVGKPAARLIKENGEAAFYGHEKMGAAMVRDLLRGLKFSNAEVDYVTEIVARHMYNLEGRAGKKAVRRFLSRIKVPINEILVARVADLKGNLALSVDRAVPFIRTVRRIQNERPPLGIKDLAVGGADLMRELGLESGPEVGRILRALLDKVLEEPERNDRETLLELAREMRGM